MTSFELLLTYSYIVVLGVAVSAFLGFQLLQRVGPERSERIEIELVEFAAVNTTSGRWRFELENAGNQTAEKIHITFQEMTRLREPLATRRLDLIREVEPNESVTIEHEIEQSELDRLELRIDCNGPYDRRVAFRRVGFGDLELESDERTVFA